MNWRNPFLVTYLSVTVIGIVIFGYLLYAGYSNWAEVDAGYFEAIQKLHTLQNRTPFPNAENNRKYVEYTEQYRAEYDRLLAKVAKMQIPVEEGVTPQEFQDRLRANVSQVVAAAKQNRVELGEEGATPEAFYLGFDQYRGTLPTDEAAGPLARELAAIRTVIDKLIELRVKRIVGISRDLLPQEGGAPAPAAQPRAPVNSGRNMRNNNNAPAASSGRVATASSFNIIFVADQGVARSALDAIVNADQFFIIRNLTIANSNPVGPKRVEDGTDPAAAQDSGGLRFVVGRETVTVGARIEIINFNTPAAAR